MRWPRLPRRREASPRDPAAQRERMVAQQLAARGIRDEELLRAFRTVPRHAFVEGNDPYGDHAMPVGAGQTISQPYVVARMTQAGRPPGGWRDARVLEVGTGSGYQAAILAELGARVTTIERHADLAERARERLAATGYAGSVRVLVGDGTAGVPEDAPYRSVLVTAGGPSVPEPLLTQLERAGGRLVMPVGGREHQFLTLCVRNGDDVEMRELEPVVFVPLIGLHGVRDG
jgi:protein-L-isoaspartate(D-aspartate) O-methyltransferase